MTENTTTDAASERRYLRERLRDNRGISMLFLLIVIPVLFAFAALAVDVGRLLEAHRSLEQAAEEAAQSGATAYRLRSGTPRLVPAQARAEARSNWQTAKALGVITAENPRMSVSVREGSRQVQVRASAEVPDLVFLRYFTIISDDAVWTVEAEGIADVCLAGFAGETACTRPDAD